MKVKKGDTVVVIAGRDKGAKGKVIAAYPTLDKVLVEGVNRVKKHTRIRSTQRGAKTGGIITQEAPDPHLERDGRRLRGQADPRRVPPGDGGAPDGRTKTNRIRVSRKSGKDL